MDTYLGRVKAEILSIGDELLLGDIVDTNKPYIARQLVQLGISPTYFQTVGDESEDIVMAFKLALSRAHVIIATGGLGPTDDDLTAACVAKALDVPLEHREDVMDQMSARLKRPKDQFTASNRKQALLPLGAHVLRNDWGTAPGIHCEAPGSRHIFLTAGVPREMKGLLGTWIVPWLKEHFPSPETITIRQFSAFGIPESRIGEQLKDLMQPGNNPDVGTRVADGVCTVRVVARAKDPAATAALLAPAVARVKEVLQEGLFGEGDETLPAVTARLLIQSKKTIALAESCTAGMVASLLAATPGISAVLLEAAVVYSNEAKVRTCGVREETLQAYGAVSAETARELAEGMRQRARTDIGVSVTGIAGPDGGTSAKPVGLFFVGVATASGTQVYERSYPGLDRQLFRERAAFTALDLVRRVALELW